MESTEDLDKSSEKTRLKESSLVETENGAFEEHEYINQTPTLMSNIAFDDNELLSNVLSRKRSIERIVEGSIDDSDSSDERSFGSEITYPANHLSELFIPKWGVSSSSTFIGSRIVQGPENESNQSMTRRSHKFYEEQAVEEHIPSEICMPFVDPFKCYVKTESLLELDCNVRKGLSRKVLPILTIEDVVIHNKEYDCWVITNGVVRDLTSLIQECKENGQYDLVKPIIANAGKDISSWFNSTTNDIRHFVHPITGVYVPYTPYGPIPDVKVQVPSPECVCEGKVPWWQDCQNVVATMTKKSRKVRVLNMLCGVEIQMLVCCEDNIYAIQDKYQQRFNWHSKSYTWKYDRQKLDMNLTLEENGIADESELFTKINLPESTYIPCLMLYFNDDLTEL